jgi:hypothetical protein
VHIGESRARTATNDHHAARLAFQSASALIAEYALGAMTCLAPVLVHRSTRSEQYEPGRLARRQFVLACIP